jgi:hypothetical protein
VRKRRYRCLSALAARRHQNRCFPEEDPIQVLPMSGCRAAVTDTHRELSTSIDAHSRKVEKVPLIAGNPPFFTVMRPVWAVNFSHVLARGSK